MPEGATTTDMKYLRRVSSDSASQVDVQRLTAASLLASGSSRASASESREW